MDINQLNIETGVFMRRLRLFSAQNCKQIDEKTIEMFMEMMLLIDKLMASAEHVPTKRNECLDFLLDLNEQHFDFRQYIMCRLCIVSSLEFSSFELW